MALTIAQLHDLVATNLADNSNIVPSEHREVEDEIINYLETTITQSSGFLQTKIITGGWSFNQGHVVDSEIGPGKTIINVTPTLICTVSNNGYAVGDIVNISPTQTNDSGGLSDSGVGVRWRADDSTRFTFNVQNRLDISNCYNGGTGTGGPVSDPVQAQPGQWNMRTVILYL